MVSKCIPCVVMVRQDRQLSIANTLSIKFQFVIVELELTLKRYLQQHISSDLRKVHKINITFYYFVILRNLIRYLYIGGRDLKGTKSNPKVQCMKSDRGNISGFFIRSLFSAEIYEISSCFCTKCSRNYIKHQ